MLWHGRPIALSIGGAVFWFVAGRSSTVERQRYACSGFPSEPVPEIVAGAQHVGPCAVAATVTGTQPIKETTMALVDVTTSVAFNTLLSDIPESDRKNALRGANPALFSEVEMIAHSPRRCRDLTAESVQEVIAWLDDPKVVHAIVSNDTRAAVAYAAKRRLTALDAGPAPSLNKKNVQERTLRALEKRDPYDALLSLKEISWSDVSTWFCNQPAYTRSRIAPDLATLAKHHSFPQMNTMLYQRAFTYQDEISIEGLWHRSGDSRAAREAVQEWTEPMNTEVAALMALAQLYPDVSPSTSVTAEAVETLVVYKRLDILGYLQAVSPERLVSLVEASNQPDRGIADVVRWTTGAKHLDALAPLLNALTPNHGMDNSALALRVSGISVATRAHLLRFASASVVIETFSTGTEMPSYDEMVRYAKEMHLDHYASIRVLVQALTSNSCNSLVEGAPSERLSAFADVLFEHAEGLLRALQTSHTSNDWFGRHCMQIVAKEFASSPDAWRVFFTAAKSHSGTLHDLVIAVKHTQ
jgi:hypothetical protein